jgi:hypothetical protein
MSRPKQKISHPVHEKAATPSDSTAGVEVFGAPAVRLTIRQAAARAGNSTRTIKRWISAGLLPATRQPSPKRMGHLRVRLGDLESVIARGAVS